MANPEHLDLLGEGAEVWNAWRAKEPKVKGNLSKANLSRANLVGANLTRANLHGANLTGAKLIKADLPFANLSEAKLRGVKLTDAKITEANLFGTNLTGANLSGADLFAASLFMAHLDGAKLIKARLASADLYGADLKGADLTGADLNRARLVLTDLSDATLTDCRIYGVSAWGVLLSEGTKQHGLIITHRDEPAITVDDLEVAQFVYLLLHNKKIRHVIDTITSKVVLILGRFSIPERKAVLNALQGDLYKRGYVPVVSTSRSPAVGQRMKPSTCLPAWHGS
jgi:hypothetical protein